MFSHKELLFQSLDFEAKNHYTNSKGRNTPFSEFLVWAPAVLLAQAMPNIRISSREGGGVVSSNGRPSPREKNVVVCFMTQLLLYVRLGQHFLHMHGTSGLART
jgi:hypothetical protein